MLTAHSYRSRTKSIQREYPRHFRPGRQPQYQQVFAAGFANARFSKTNIDTRDGAQLLWLRQRKIDRHPDVPLEQN